jgi:hypothetical protein
MNNTHCIRAFTLLLPGKTHEHESVVDMPRGSKILSAQLALDSDEQIYLWALCNTSAKTEPTRFTVYQTGQVFEQGDEHKQFIGTVQRLSGGILRQGTRTYHIFQDPVRSEGAEQ